MKIIKKIRSVNKKITYKIKVFLVYIFFTKKYFIKRGYLHRTKYKYFDDTSNTDNWQLEVYKKAKELVEINNYKTIIDYGCGSGYKLVNYFEKYDTHGIDLSPTYEFLLKKYPQRKWLRFGDFEMNELSGDVVICSDVIEHVLNPDELIDNIKKIKDIKYYVFSTPDRDLAPTKSFGPPSNPTHIREWNFKEFNLYLKKHFDIVSHYISNRNQWTQLIIAKRKKKNIL